MHKKLHTLIISTLVTSALLLRYTVKADTVSTLPKHAKQIIQVDSEDNLGLLKGHLSDNKSKDMKGVIEFFKENKDLFHLEDPESELKLISITNDSLGYTHIKVQQVYNGIEIFGNQYVIHFNNEGCIYSVNGDLDPDICKKYSPSKTCSNITGDKAIDIAKKSVNIAKTAFAPKAKFYIFNLDEEYMPVYEIKLSTMEPEVSNWIVYVNSETGDVVKKINHIDNIDSIGEGTGVLGDKKTLNVTASKDEVSLVNTSSGITIKTYDGSHIPGDQPAVLYAYLPGNLYSKTTNKFNDERDKAAVDAHCYAKVVYDYYKDKFGRNSIDNKGMDIISTVHVGNKLNNAMWTENQMVYGDGDGSTTLPLSGAIDIVAHELTHGVDDFSANLYYEGQSGALNESFSDVFGTLIKFDYKKGNATYLIGENIWAPGTGKGLRDLENPNGPKTCRIQPDHMRKYIPDGDNHENSGIPNKAAFLIMKSIGHDKTAKIYYDALTIDLTSKVNFRKAKLALIESAKRNYGENSAEAKAVADAFTAVGIK